MNEKPFTPKYSFWPLFLAVAVLLIAVGLVSTFVISLLGLLLVFVSMIGWTWENRADGQEEADE